MTTMRIRPATLQGHGSRIDAAKSGADWAWGELYRELAGPVTGYLRSRGAPDPEDLCSEVFLQIARDIHRFEGDEDNFRSWVFVIAHRRLIDDRRARSRRPDTVDDGSAALEYEGGDVEEEVMAQLSEAGIAEVLGTLTDDQRNVLALRIIADLSLEETATVMNKRVGAIKALQRRALLSIKRQLEQGALSI